MKKIFNLTHSKTKPARLVEAAKNDIRKYLKRERKKTLSEGADYWDFDCKFGPTPEESKMIHWSEISKFIDEANEQQLESFYVEILVKPGHRKTKPAEL